MDDRNTLMFNAQKEMTGAGDYTWLLEKVVECQRKTTAYVRAWIEIQVFDRKNKGSAAAKRFVGSHAFNQKKADMGEMRAMLRELGALRG